MILRQAATLYHGALAQRPHSLEGSNHNWNQNKTQKQLQLLETDRVLLLPAPSNRLEQSCFCEEGRADGSTERKADSQL